MKVEYFLQVAFYAEMLDALLAEAGHGHVPIALGIVYRGPAEGDTRLTDDDRARLKIHKAIYVDTFGPGPGLLDLVTDPQQYRDAVSDLVTGPEANARALATAEFDSLPFHLTGKCDNCLYNEFCLRRSADRDDLSLLPLITERDKAALQRNGITTVADVAALKSQGGNRLVPDPAHIAMVRKLSGTWPIGRRLDELVHRARATGPTRARISTYLRYIPDSGYSSLPSTTPDLNPNLVLIYLDAQLDHLQDRVYQVGALVVGHDAGQRHRSAAGPYRRHRRTAGQPGARGRAVHRLDRGRPARDQSRSPRRTLRASRAPRSTWSSTTPTPRRSCSTGWRATTDEVLATTPLYDFVTQIAAYDSPILTHLDSQIRAQKNYPLLGPDAAVRLGVAALPLVAGDQAGLPPSPVRFSWPDAGHVGLRPRAGRRLLRPPGAILQPGAARVRLRRLGPACPMLDRGGDGYKPYREATPELSQRPSRPSGWRRWSTSLATLIPTAKHPWASSRSPTWPDFEDKAESLARALDEFVIIERHADMAAWKAAHLPPPERRALVGDALIVRYRDADQDPEIVAQNRENERRRQLRLEYEAQLDDDGAPRKLTKDEKDETKWTQEGMQAPARHRDRRTGYLTARDCSRSPGSGRASGSSSILAGPTIPGCPRTSSGRSRPPRRAMLYGIRADIEQLVVEETGADGQPVRATATAKFVSNDYNDPHKFTFGTMSTHDRPLVDGDLYTLGPDPNNYYGSWCAKVVHGLEENGQHHALYRRLERPDQAAVTWPEEAAAGQAHFLRRARRAARRRRHSTPSRRARGTSSAATAMCRPCWSRDRPAPARATPAASPCSPGSRGRWPPGATTGSSSRARRTRPPTCCWRTWSLPSNPREAASDAPRPLRASSSTPGCSTCRSSG